MNTEQFFIEQWASKINEKLETFQNQIKEKIDEIHQMKVFEKTTADGLGKEKLSQGIDKLLADLEEHKEDNIDLKLFIENSFQNNYENLKHLLKLEILTFKSKVNFLDDQSYGVSAGLNKRYLKMSEKIYLELLEKRKRITNRQEITNNINIAKLLYTSERLEKSLNNGTGDSLGQVNLIESGEDYTRGKSNLAEINENMVNFNIINKLLESGKFKLVPINDQLERAQSTKDMANVSSSTVVNESQSQSQSQSQFSIKKDTRIENNKESENTTESQSKHAALPRQKRKYTKQTAKIYQGTQPRKPGRPKKISRVGKMGRPRKSATGRPMGRPRKNSDLNSTNIVDKPNKVTTVGKVGRPRKVSLEESDKRVEISNEAKINTIGNSDGTEKQTDIATGKNTLGDNKNNENIREQPLPTTRTLDQVLSGKVAESAASKTSVTTLRDEKLAAGSEKMEENPLGKIYFRQSRAKGDPLKNLDGDGYFSLNFLEDYQGRRARTSSKQISYKE